MNTARLTAACLCLLLAACSAAPGKPVVIPAPEAAPFENRVWRVIEAGDIPVGTRMAFLSDSSLLVFPPQSNAPKVGRWHFAGGGIVMIEEGYRYPADILEKGNERFALRLHRPSGPVDVVMVPGGIEN